MEELAYVAGKIVKGVAGLAYAFGDTLVGLGPEGKDQERGKKPGDEKKSEGTKEYEGEGEADGKR
ncbi:hypothetical protein [Streptomyces sp. TBY4]|uniref:hypothetical protein n=1 Tax=Streptomyces sp. TBY4 TaxID=2962030 RepID=UPI0020B81AFA|nr:hypothetical protein [Streptomyces sp. TBY4]MCP3758533.1 hypothetical protein [Streptomyces sp. TBY4]